MNAVLEAQEPSARYLEAPQPALVRQFDVLATSPGGVARLRELIRTLALQGKLSEQNSRDESATALLARARRKLPHADTKPAAVVEEEEQWCVLPASWAWTRLGELVLSSEAGWSPSCVETPRQSDRWGVLKVSAVSWGKFDPNANKALPDGLDPRPEFEVKDGDFLLSRANTAELVARSVVVSDPPPRLMLSDKIIRLKLSKEVDPRYINLANNSSGSRAHYIANASGTSSSMKNVSRDVVLRLPIPLPPLAEQARIVARVADLMRLCDALEAKGRLEAEQHARLLGTLLGTLTDSSTPEELAANWQRVAEHFDLLLDRPEAVDALEQTILHLGTSGRLTEQQPGDDKVSARLSEVETMEDPFDLPHGWVWTSLEHLVALVTSGSRSWKDFYSEEGTTFIRSQDIKHDRLEFDKRAFVKLPAAAEGVRTQVQLKDLLITITGANVGKAAVITDSIGDAYVSQHVALVRLSDTRLADYLHLWLVNKHGGRRMLLTSSYGAKPGLNLKNIRNLPVPLPPLAEQARIVARVAELRRLCADLRQRLATAQATQSHLADALVERALA